MANPSVIVLAGPNGAGKTTAAKVILADLVQITDFVNADVIAQGLSGFAPENAALEAGRIMLRRLHDLAESRVSFAFETTLASRSFAPWIAELVASGYEFQLFFFWVPSPEFSIQRVANRVKLGGHFVDPDTIRRRFRRGLENLFHLYLPLTSDWFMYDYTQSPGESLIARGHGKLVDEVGNAALCSAIKAKYDTPR